MCVSHQSTQTTSAQMISWVLWLWASAGRNWTTPKSSRTSTSTASSSEPARYDQPAECVFGHEWWLSMIHIIHDSFTQAFLCIPYLWSNLPFLSQAFYLPSSPRCPSLHPTSGKFHLPILSKVKPNQTLGCSSRGVWPALTESAPNHVSTLMDYILVMC